MMLRLLKYCVIGVLNTAASYVVYAVLVWLAMPAALALAIGYVAGMVTSYLLNGKWTFATARLEWFHLRRYTAANVVLLGLSEVLLHVILLRVSSPYLAQALNLVPMTLIGFLVNQRYVFSDKPVTEERKSASREAFVYFSTAVLIVLCQRVFLLVSTLALYQHSRLRFTWQELLVRGYQHFDSGWYIEIARFGYTTHKQMAFWPLYPLIMRTVNAVFGCDLATSGILISLVSFVVTIYFLGRLAKLEFGGRAAVLAMLLLASFPTSFFMDAIYTESLFLALAIGAVYASRTGRFFTAWFLMALATLTRNTGLFLAVIVCFDYLRVRGMDLCFWRKIWWKRLDWKIAYALLPVLAIGGWSLWLQFRTGHFNEYMLAERYWHRSYMPLWQTFTKTVHLLQHPWLTVMTPPYMRRELEAVIFAVLTVIIGLCYVRKSWTHVGWVVYLAVVTWITSTEPSTNIPDYLVSFPRYVLMLFPGFIYFGHLLRRYWLYIPVLAFFLMMLYMNNQGFFRGAWIA